MGLPLLAAALAACGSRGPSGASADAPPVAALVEITDTLPLGAQLARLAGMADSASRQETTTRARTAGRMEALTDGLLEAKLPFQQLASGYSLESRLRQLQALADRIVAEQQAGGMEDTVRTDLRLMSRQAEGLQAALKRPGGPTPPPMDSLLAAWNRNHGPSIAVLPSEAPATPAPDTTPARDTAVAAPDTTGAARDTAIPDTTGVAGGPRLSPSGDTAAARDTTA